MFFGVYKRKNEVISDFYYNYNKWHSDTFSPDTEILAVLDMTIHGKNYAEKKADTVRLAQDYQNLYAEGISLSYYAVCTIENYLRKQGIRYGLVREFRENAVC